MEIECNKMESHLDLCPPGFVGAKFPLLFSGTRIFQGPQGVAAFSHHFFRAKKFLVSFAQVELVFLRSPAK